MYYNYTLYQPKKVIQDIQKLNTKTRYFSNGDVKTTPLTKVGDAFDSWQAENTAPRKVPKKDAAPRKTTTPIHVNILGDDDQIPVHSEASRFGPLVQAEPAPTVSAPRRYAAAIGLPLLAVGAGIIGLSFLSPARPGTTATPTVYSGGTVLGTSTTDTSGSDSSNKTTNAGSSTTPQPISASKSPYSPASTQPATQSTQAAPTVPAPQPQAPSVPTNTTPTVSTPPTPDPTPAPVTEPVPTTGGIIQDVVPVVNAIQTDVQNITTSTLNTLP